MTETKTKSSYDIIDDLGVLNSLEMKEISRLAHQVYWLVMDNIGWAPKSVSERIIHELARQILRRMPEDIKEQLCLKN